MKLFWKCFLGYFSIVKCILSTVQTRTTGECDEPDRSEKVIQTNQLNFVRIENWDTSYSNSRKLLFLKRAPFFIQLSKKTFHENLVCQEKAPGYSADSHFQFSVWIVCLVTRRRRNHVFQELGFVLKFSTIRTQIILDQLAALRVGFGPFGSKGTAAAGIAYSRSWICLKIQNDQQASYSRFVLKFSTTAAAICSFPSRLWFPPLQWPPLSSFPSTFFASLQICSPPSISVFCFHFSRPCLHRGLSFEIFCPLAMQNFSLYSRYLVLGFLWNISMRGGAGRREQNILRA